MLVLAGKIVDTHALLNVIWASLVAGVGGTAAFSVAIAGATRFAEMRRAGRSLEAGMFAAAALAGLGICLAAITYGLFEIINK
jgi:hypothetical protein